MVFFEIVDTEKRLGEKNMAYLPFFFAKSSLLVYDINMLGINLIFLSLKADKSLRPKMQFFCNFVCLLHVFLSCKRTKSFPEKISGNCK